MTPLNGLTLPSEAPRVAATAVSALRIHPHNVSSSSYWEPEQLKANEHEPRSFFKKKIFIYLFFIKAGTFGRSTEVFRGQDQRKPRHKRKPASEITNQNCSLSLSKCVLMGFKLLLILVSLKCKPPPSEVGVMWQGMFMSGGRNWFFFCFFLRAQTFISLLFPMHTCIIGVVGCHRNHYNSD